MYNRRVVCITPVDAEETGWEGLRKLLEVTELGRADLAFAVRSVGEPGPRQYLSYPQLPAPSGASV